MDQIIVEKPAVATMVKSLGQEVTVIDLPQPIIRKVRKNKASTDAATAVADAVDAATAVDVAIEDVSVKSSPEGPHFRSYDMLPPVDTVTVERLRGRVIFLSGLPQPAQRSEQWYKMRDQMLTASDWGSILGENHYADSTESAVIQSKCGAAKAFTGNDATRWGQKYEDVAVQIYERRNNVKIRNFGLIPHSEYAFLGASPDGITDDGIMVEIKCPPSRVITGVTPRHYWAQVQAQLEVCQLERCDFLECKLEEYDDEDQFYADCDPNNPLILTESHGMEKGVIVVFIDRNDKTKSYEYLPLGMTKEECTVKVREAIVKRKAIGNFALDEVTYWRLVRVSCVQIYRDRGWFASALPKLRATWEKIENYRKSGTLPPVPEKKKNNRADEDYVPNPIKGTNPFANRKRNTAASSAQSSAPPPPPQVTKGPVRGVNPFAKLRAASNVTPANQTQEKSQAISEPDVQTSTSPVPPRKVNPFAKAKKQVEADNTETTSPVPPRKVNPFAKAKKQVEADNTETTSPVPPKKVNPFAKAKKQVEADNTETPSPVPPKKVNPFAKAKKQVEPDNTETTSPVPPKKVNPFAKAKKQVEADNTETTSPVPPKKMNPFAKAKAKNSSL